MRGRNEPRRHRDRRPFGHQCADRGRRAAAPGSSPAWTRVADSTGIRRPLVATAGDAAFRRGEMGSGWGSPLVTHEPGRLAVEYTFFSAYDLQPRLRFTYALDGSESRNSVMIGHASVEQRSRVAGGEHARHHDTRARPAGADGRAVTAEVRQALTLESPHVLRIETTRVGVLGGATNTTQATYTKR